MNFGITLLKTLPVKLGILTILAAGKSKVFIKFDTFRSVIEIIYEKTEKDKQMLFR